MRREEGSELVERACGGRAGIRELAPRGRVLDLRGDQVSRVRCRGLRLADRAIEVHAWRASELDVRHPIGDHARHLQQARACRLRQLVLRYVAGWRRHPSSVWLSCRPRRTETRSSRSMRSPVERSASPTPRKRSSHASSRSIRSWKRAALVSSRRSSYSVRPRLVARVGESSYSSFRNVSTSEPNGDGTLRLLAVG